MGRNGFSAQPEAPQFSCSWGDFHLQIKCLRSKHQGKSSNPFIPQHVHNQITKTSENFQEGFVHSGLAGCELELWLNSPHLLTVSRSQYLLTHNLIYPHKYLPIASPFPSEFPCISLGPFSCLKIPLSACFPAISSLRFCFF